MDRTPQDSKLAAKANWRLRETVLQQAIGFRADELLDACFDIDHGMRRRGAAVASKNEQKKGTLPYVLVISIVSDTAEQVYSRVLQRYAKLRPIQLRQEVRLRLKR